jgi:hypothetical protein
MFDLGFIRKRGKSARADAVPRTLSEELLRELTGAGQAPETGGDDRRAFGRIRIGTRATLRLASEDSKPVSVLLRDLCVASVGILVDSPVITGAEYWIYIPKPQNPDEVVALCCVIVRCDAGGFERSAYVAAASFIEGDPPALPASQSAAQAEPPNQLEEEGHLSFTPRPGSHLFLPSSDPTPVAATSPPAESVDSDQAAPVLASAPPAAPAPPPPIAAPVEPAPPPQDAILVEPAAPPPAPPASPPRPVRTESSPEISQPAKAPVTHDAPATPFTEHQIRKMGQTLQPHLAYLKRMINRMDHQGIGPDDPLRQELIQACQSVEQLCRRVESIPTPAPASAPASAPATAPVGAEPAKPTRRPAKADAIECLMLLRRQALLPSIN